jgi:hypothetical protein
MRPTPKITPKLVVAIVEQARNEAAEEAALRIPSPLAVAVLLAGVIGIGWMVRSTWAQEAGKPAVESPEPLPSPPALGETKSVPAPAAADLPFNSTPDVPIASENDDPEKTVQAFVDQNRKTAEDQLKSLKSEAERLRARLHKVEAGIKRWELLLTALDKSEAAAKDLEAPRPKARVSKAESPIPSSAPLDLPPPGPDEPQRAPVQGPK